MLNEKKELRVLSVVFDCQLKPWELVQFRGAISHKVGLEYEWFHNHNNNPNEPDFHYRYPLIQYKLHHSNPMILCIDKGVEEIQHFFTKPDWNLKIKNRDLAIRIKSLNVHQYDMQVHEKMLKYRVYNCLALNQQNHKKYQTLTRLSEKLVFLEKHDM